MRGEHGPERFGRLGPKSTENATIRRNVVESEVHYPSECREADFPTSQ